MGNLTQGPEILAVLRMMHSRAATNIQIATGNVSSTTEAMCSSDIMTNNTPIMTNAGNFSYESLLFGIDFSDMQPFYDMNSVDSGLEVSNMPDPFQLNHQKG
jgi:hypothetical protein